LFRKFKFREAIYMKKQIAKPGKVNFSSFDHIQVRTWDRK